MSWKATISVFCPTEESEIGVIGDRTTLINDKEYDDAEEVIAALRRVINLGVTGNIELEMTEVPEVEEYGSDYGDDLEIPHIPSNVVHLSEEVASTKDDSKNDKKEPPKNPQKPDGNKTEKKDIKK